MNQGWVKIFEWFFVGILIVICFPLLIFCLIGKWADDCVKEERTLK
jgi:hypothetical protein